MFNEIAYSVGFPEPLTRKHLARYLYDRLMKRKQKRVITSRGVSLAGE